MNKHSSSPMPGSAETSIARQYVSRLQRFTAAVSSAVRMRDVAQVLFEQGLEHFGARAVGIVWMMRPGKLELVFGHGVTTAEFQALDAAARAGARLPIRDAITGRRSVWLDSPEQIRAEYPVLEEMRVRRGESGFAVVPLVVGEKSPGVIGFTFSRAEPFTDAERSYVETLARVSAQAFERARLFEAEQAARLEAERIGKVQQQLMAVVGHDLRTPLSSILVSSQFLASKAGLTEDAERLVRRIASSATRMSVIIGDLVDYGRVRQGLGLTLNEERVDLAELARTALHELSGQAQGRARLTASGDTVIGCDPGRIVQVASNLVENALRHGSGEPVEVRVAGVADAVVLSVHNAGPAIPAELLPHVFEPFRQASEPGVNVGSTGLGLFIVREIVSAHGGSVDVVSDATAGTTFTVRIPRGRRDRPR